MKHEGPGKEAKAEGILADGDEMKRILRGVQDAGCTIQHLSDALELASDQISNHPYPEGDDYEMRRTNGAHFVIDTINERLRGLGVKIEADVIKAVSMCSEMEARP